MQRRTLLRTGATLGAAAFAATPASVRRAVAQSDQFPPLAFDSTASLLDADRRPLTDESLIAVRAEDTAYNGDEDDGGDAVPYPEDTRVPLVVSDSPVVGFGAPIVQDDTNFSRGNEEFVLNVLDAELGGDGTVLFDEGHGQFYDAASFSTFIDYAESNGYEVNPTSDLAADLDTAQGAIVTSPIEAFSESELDALSTFIGEGGSLLLFSQSDFRNYDATANVNAVADAVGADFRFNDDQVFDPENNAGPNYVPVTDEFNTAFPYFEERPGLGLDLDRSETYTVDVVGVTDGDTIDVQFDDGTEDTVRVLGIDAPETSRGPERAQEWEGIESVDYLLEQGAAASEYASELLGGETVEIGFDEHEPLRGDFGRLLAYVTVDGTLYNRRAIADGHARVYDSGFARHDEFLESELDARADGHGLWSRSDPDAAPTIRNEPVEELFFPRATSVTATGEPLDRRRVPVAAESTARQEGDPEVRYDDDVPLVGVDQLAGVAMVGAPLIDESYESEEGFDADTSGYGNFPFLTNLIDRISDREAGPVLVDGGHGQFDAPYALSAEDAAYYLRYLEGVDVGFEGVNRIADGFGATLLDDARAIVVTTPPEAFTDAEIDALDTFVSDGGGVILMGAAGPAAARENLDAISAGLCSDLRLNTGRVVDPTAALAGRPSVPTTSNFDTWFRLFGEYTGETKFKGARGDRNRPAECRDDDPSPPPVVGDRPPTDPDGDGLYEDVNGDGEVNYADVVDFFDNFDSAAVRNNPAAFDFNGNGGVDFADVVALFDSL